MIGALGLTALFDGSLPGLGALLVGFLLGAAASRSLFSLHLGGALLSGLVCRLPPLLAGTTLALQLAVGGLALGFGEVTQPRTPPSRSPSGGG